MFSNNAVLTLGSLGFVRTAAGEYTRFARDTVGVLYAHLVAFSTMGEHIVLHNFTTGESSALTLAGLVEALS